MRIIRAHDQRAMPWKNGGGVTYEIAVYPDGATLEAFKWRLSMARVNRDGPFSMFPGIDRSLGIVDGEGVKLHVATYGEMTASHDTQPVSFPADVITTGSLIAGPVLDLNVMTRRTSWTHRMSIRPGIDGLETCSADVRIIVVREGPIVIEVPEGAITLHHRDAIMLAGGAPVLHLKAGAGATFFQIELVRHGSCGRRDSCLRAEP